MLRPRTDRVHKHACWHMQIRVEYSDDGALHRHRIVGPDRLVRYTTWSHNTESHAHRLPDGAWTRPRTDLTPPVMALVAASR